jgi:hypothetical protein
MGGTKIRAVLDEAERFLEILTDPGSSYAVCEICMGPAGVVR